MLLAGFAMGTLVAAASLATYGSLATLDFGATVIFIGLLAGMAVGVRLRASEPQVLVIAGFVASSFAILIVVLSIYAPVFAGVVPGLEALGSTDTARVAYLFASLFLIPIHLVGCVIGYALADFLAPGRDERRKIFDRV